MIFYEEQHRTYTKVLGVIASTSSDFYSQCQNPQLSSEERLFLRRNVVLHAGKAVLLLAFVRSAITFSDLEWARDMAKVLEEAVDKNDFDLVKAMNFKR